MSRRDAPTEGVRGNKCVFGSEIPRLCFATLGMKCGWEGWVPAFAGTRIGRTRPSQPSPVKGEGVCRCGTGFFSYQWHVGENAGGSRSAPTVGRARMGKDGSPPPRGQREGGRAIPGDEILRLRCATLRACEEIPPRRQFEHVLEAKLSLKSGVLRISSQALRMTCGGGPLRRG